MDLSQPSLPLDSRVAVVVAHPDDETIGIGAHLAMFRHLTLIHITDGAPRSGSDAAAAGFARPALYAAARGAELKAALAAGEVRPERSIGLGYHDQEAVFAARTISTQLAELFSKHAIDTVLTHAYEGGHPDHDTVAFAVARAAPARIIEMAFYNSFGIGTFLGGEGSEIHLSAEQQVRKRRMFDCFKTQTRVLASFSHCRERLRIAPRYDFTRPPHPGALYYERFDWAVDGTRWRELIAAC